MLLGDENFPASSPHLFYVSPHSFCESGKSPAMLPVLTGLWRGRACAARWQPGCSAPQHLSQPPDCVLLHLPVTTEPSRARQLRVAPDVFALQRLNSPRRPAARASRVRCTAVVAKTQCSILALKKTSFYWRAWQDCSVLTFCSSRERTGTGQPRARRYTEQQR